MTMEVFDRDGRAVRLGPPGPSGGEGTIHRVLDAGAAAAKIFHPNRLTEELHRKLVTMTSAAPTEPNGHRSIAWADRVLYRDRDRRSFCGFTMPLVDTEVFKQAHIYYDPQDRLRRFGGNFTWRHLFTAAHNLASAVAAVHAQGHRVGDLRETNVLVGPHALVTLIDCDSFQIADRTTMAVYPTRVATGDYLPPELQGVDFRRDAPDRLRADLFALAVLVFRFLMLGVHPFQARGARVAGAPSTEAKIRAGIFPYGRRLGSGIAPPEYAPDWEFVPRELRALFSRCFVRGHCDPVSSPSAGEWVAALGAAAMSLSRCRANANHWHASRSCPWCAHARRQGADPFPPPVPAQVALQSAQPVPRAARVEQLRTLVRVAVSDGPLRPEERTHLKDQATLLGVGGGDLDRLVDAELRARPPAPVPVETPRRRWELARPTVDLRKAGAALPVALPMIAAAIAAPVLAPLTVALFLTPVAATFGQGIAEPAPPWRTAAFALPRFVSNFHMSVVHLVAALPAAVIAAAVLLRGPPAAGRAAAALSVAGWAWLVMREVPQDALRGRVRAAATRLGPHLVHSSGRPSRPAVALLVLGAAMLAAGSLLDPLWWPLGPR